MFGFAIGKIWLDLTSHSLCTGVFGWFLLRGIMLAVFSTLQSSVRSSGELVCCSIVKHIQVWCCWLVLWFSVVCLLFFFCSTSRTDTDVRHQSFAWNGIFYETYLLGYGGSRYRLVFWSFSDAVKDFHCIVLNLLFDYCCFWNVSNKESLFCCCIFCFFHSHFENFLLASCSSFGEFVVVIAVLF